MRLKNISIHALLAESDVAAMVTPPAPSYFYPRSPCGERPIPPLVELVELVISIHALLAESDPECLIGRRSHLDFYPRSPCGERRKPARKARHER